MIYRGIAWLILWNLLLLGTSLASGHWEPNHGNDGQHWVEDDDSTPTASPAPIIQQTPAPPRSQDSDKQSLDQSAKDRATMELAKSIVEKAIDKLVGTIFGSDPSTIAEVAGSKDQNEAFRVVATAVASKAIDKVLESVNPALGFLDIALHSTSTATDDGIKYNDTPFDVTNQKNRGIIRP